MDNRKWSDAIEPHEFSSHVVQIESTIDTVLPNKQPIRLCRRILSNEMLHNECPWNGIE